jgi:hypothetical protein
VAVYAFTGGQRKALVDPLAYVAGARVPVQTVHAYHGGQRTLVWSRTPTTLAAVPLSTSQVRLTWTAPGAGADSYRLRRGGTQIYAGPALTFTDSGLPAGTAFTWTVDALRGGVVVSTATANASTLPVVIEDRFVSLFAVTSASFNGAGANRNVPDTFYGQFSTVHGNQRSLWCFDIPAEVRNCVAIDRIDIAVFNQHHFQGGGNAVALVVHHGDFRGGFPGQFPGSTTALNFNGAVWRPMARRNAWLDAGANDGGWMTNCQGLAAAGRATLAEEFRVGGAWGLGLIAPSTAQAHYGYGQGATQTNRPQLRLWFRVRVG